MDIILATDCGSTTTKARLFRKIGNEYRFVCSGEAPTTVEAPYEDVTLGIFNAVREIEELSGLGLLTRNGIKTRLSKEEEGVDLYVTTSSAGGGLQMMVFGVTRSITAESAERVSLGGGAIVMDVVTVDDGKPTHMKVENTRYLRPDMVLIAGGTDGGSVAPVVQTAEILRIADPKARFGETYSLPVIFAGNKSARDVVKKTLGDKFALRIVENIRPIVELENSDPARAAIQELFMEHVMSHAPGYDKLMKWTPIPIMPTPSGEGMMFQTYAQMYNVNLIGVGLGGATTNIYSIYDGRFVRSVSANLGMSYSICNVLKEAGIENIIRWIPFDIDEDFLVDILTNKMIRPTTIPQSLDELIIEQAVAREALRLGFAHHKLLARPLRGARPVAEFSLDMKVVGLESYIDMLRVDTIGGTGGLLSHAPRRVQTALLLIDGFLPEGVTKLIQDSIFMMPHLGVLSTVHSKAALEIFEKDCLVRLGTCIAPKGLPEEKDREGELLKVELNMPDGTVRTESLSLGDIICVPLPQEEVIDVKITPHKRCDIGAGFGHVLNTKVQGGVAGIIIDMRGRPLILPQDKTAMKNMLNRWLKSLDVYEEKTLNRCVMGV